LRYVGAIFVSGAGLWTLLSVRMLISPPSYADICGDPAGMCCIPCAAGVWFMFVPTLDFLVALTLLLPGDLLVSWIARRATWWRPVYWIAGWVVTSVIAAVLFDVALAIGDREIIALNINNGILARKAWEFAGFAIGFAVFGLLCGLCYRMMLVRVARKADAGCRLPRTRVSPLGLGDLLPFGCSPSGSRLIVTIRTAMNAGLRRKEQFSLWPMVLWNSSTSPC
jgi:hypothetical protein